MSRLIQFSLLLVVVVFGAAGYFIFQYLTVNDMARQLRGGSPLGIRLAFTEESSSGTTLEGFAQMIVYPEKRKVLFYFLNSDASYRDQEEKIMEMSPSAADRFSQFTDVKSSYYIHVSRDQFSRLIDLMGGMPYYIEEIVELENSKFQYPPGRIFFNGPQTAEFLYQRKVEPDPTRNYLTGVERVHRMESVLLNLQWRLEDYYDRLSPEGVWNTFSSIPDTNLSADEFRSLLRYLATDGVYTAILEVPLEVARGKRIGAGVYENKLFVKNDRARNVYLEFYNRLQGEKKAPGGYMVEVLNGTETPGLARRARQNIQIRDVVVMNVDNFAYKPVPETVILDRGGSSQLSEDLRRIANMGKESVFFRRKNLEVDTTLILGNDFRLKDMKLY